MRARSGPDSRVAVWLGSCGVLDASLAQAAACRDTIDGPADAQCRRIFAGWFMVRSMLQRTSRDTRGQLPIASKYALRAAPAAAFTCLYTQPTYHCQSPGVAWRAA
jgi:hypothetical protein